MTKTVTREWIFENFPKINYITIDEDGAIAAYEHEPKITENFWGGCDRVNISFLGLEIEYNGDWKKSLIKRPGINTPGHKYLDKVHKLNAVHSCTQNVPDEYLIDLFDFSIKLIKECLDA